MNEQLVSEATYAADSGNASATVKPDGDLVAAALPALRARLREMIAGGVRHLTLDFTGVQAVDSMGIGALVSTHNSLQKAGGDLAVVHASREILDLFRAMRIHQHFSVTGD